MKRTRKYERVIWEKRDGGSAVSSHFVLVIAFSQFRGVDYLGASKRPEGVRVVKLSDRRRNCYGDMDNLVYDITLFFSIFFFKYMFTEGVPQRSLYNVIFLIDLFTDTGTAQGVGLGGALAPPPTFLAVDV